MSKEETTLKSIENIKKQVDQLSDYTQSKKENEEAFVVSLFRTCYFTIFGCLIYFFVRYAIVGIVKDCNLLEIKYINIFIYRNRVIIDYLSQIEYWVRAFIIGLLGNSSLYVLIYLIVTACINQFKFIKKKNE